MEYVARLGEIDTFLAAVGHSPAEGNPASIDILGLLSTNVDKQTFDSETYWSFFDVGAELLWRDQVLISSCVFTQGDPDNGYDPYPRSLFTEFSNRATPAQVQAVLGAPDATGPEWIRYDDIHGAGLHLQFDADRLWSVTALAASWRSN